MVYAVVMVIVGVVVAEGNRCQEKCQYFRTLQMREVAVALCGERSDILEVREVVVSALVAVVVSALVVVALLTCIYMYMYM